MEPSSEFTSNDPESTITLGKKLGSFMQRGQIIALSGELGAGKTTLVKAIALGAGIPGDVVVSSPSYTLVNEYYGKMPVYHFDLYRLEGADDIHELGYDEYLEGEGLSLVEWADIAPELLPKEHLKIHITIRSEESRTISLMPLGKQYERIVERLKAQQSAGA